MGDCNFNKRQCIKALKGLGFYLNNDRRGDHDKYHFPSACIIPTGHRPFIMIPRHNELRLQHKIINELRAVGGDELVEKFTHLL